MKNTHKTFIELTPWVARSLPEVGLSLKLIHHSQVKFVQILDTHGITFSSFCFILTFRLLLLMLSLLLSQRGLNKIISLTFPGFPPPLKSRRPFGSFVRNMKEIDPDKELFQTGNAQKYKYNFPLSKWTIIQKLITTRAMLSVKRFKYSIKTEPVWFFAIIETFL